MPNLFDPLPETRADEQVDTLLEGARFRLERIVSTGQATPPGEWFDQAEDEWVVLLSGAADLRLAERAAPLRLRPGEWLLIPAHCRHRVEWTAPGEPTVWLALHCDASAGQPL